MARLNVRNVAQEVMKSIELHALIVLQELPLWKDQKINLNVLLAKLDILVL